MVAPAGRPLRQAGRIAAAASDGVRASVRGSRAALPLAGA